AGEPACWPNAPGPLCRLAGGGVGRLCADVLREKPLLNDDDVPEWGAAGTLPAKARQSARISADRRDFMMSFHQVVE
ncbi:hypothetical protein, partial [Duganella callida]|uniref:hypothetical protein n=1 Tax=Duganella callida TaxID=2561932 RepID=UPI00197A7263